MIFENIVKCVASTSDVDPHTCTAPHLPWRAVPGNAVRCKCCAASGVICHCPCDAAARGFVHFVPKGDAIDSARCIDGLAAIWLGLLHQISIAIIEELCSLAIDSDRDQAVFGVEGLGISESAFYALGHIAVGVISITFASAEGGHRMFVGRLEDARLRTIVSSCKSG